MQINVKKTGKRWEAIDYFMILFLLIPLIEPDGMSHISPTLSNLIWRGGIRYLVMAIIVFRFILKLYYEKKFEAGTNYIFLFIFMALLITVMHNVSKDAWITNFSNAILICLLAEIYHKKLPKLISVALFYFEILIILNLICMILFPNGMYYTKATGYHTNWLLGYKSSFQYYIIPGIALGWLNSSYKKRNFHFWLLLMIVIIESIMSKNMMLVVGVSILIFVYIFRLNERTSICNSAIYFTAVGIVNVVILYFNTEFVSSPLGSFVFKLLKKDVRISGRTNIIWPRAMEYINEKPWAGYGVLSSTKHADMLGLSAAIHAHNQILEILFCGGIILFVTFLIWMFVLNKRMMSIKNLKTTQILGCCICVTLIMVSVEVFMRWCGGGIWLLFWLASNAKKIDEQYSLQPNHARRKRIKLL